MRYELLLQSALPGTAFEHAVVEAAVDARQATRRPDGSWVLRLAHGEVELSRWVEAAQVKALVLKVPLSHQLELIRETLHWALDVARETGTAVVDPALMRCLSANDEGALTDAYLQTARYAGQYLGVSEAVIASYGAAEPVGMGTQGKVLLAIAAFLAAVFWAWRSWQ